MQLSNVLTQNVIFWNITHRNVDSVSNCKNLMSPECRFRKKTKILSSCGLPTLSDMNLFMFSLPKKNLDCWTNGSVNRNS